MTYFKVPLLIVLCAGSAACQSIPNQSESSASHVSIIHDVKTTAYTHTEGDHLQHGSQNAAGSKLKYGEVRSAAADWSVYPVGTKFKISGEPFVYEVDDYGSALIGTHTIDLYKPTQAAMNGWGARHVDIDVIEWGSFTRSLAILKPREHAKGTVHKMVNSIEGRDKKQDVASTGQ